MPPTQTEKPLTAKQLQACRLLASGLLQREVAEELGLSKRTIERWNTSQAFKDATNALMGTKPLAKPSQSKAIEPELLPYTSQEEGDYPKNYEEAMARMPALLMVSINTVLNILTDPDERPANKLKAASLAGEWLGLKYCCRASAAVDLLHSLGYVITEGHVEDEDDY